MVCRVFKKKSQTRGYQQEFEEEENLTHMMRANGPCQILEPKHHHQMQQGLYDYSFDGTIHLPQLFSPESAAIAPTSMNAMDILECSQNLLRLTTTNTSCGLNLMQHQQQQGERFSGDWSFLDKLLASNHGMDQNQRNKCHAPSHLASAGVGTSSAQKFPFDYLGCEPHDIMKFSK